MQIFKERVRIVADFLPRLAMIFFYQKPAILAKNQEINRCSLWPDENESYLECPSKFRGLCRPGLLGVLGKN